MYVTSIEVRQLPGTHSIARTTNTLVTFLGKSQNISVNCSMPCDSAKPNSPALLADAIRQLRRMPEYRTGHRRLEFCPSLGLTG